ncbi:MULTISPECIES: hypothetical protein [Bacillus amyloliquefaciens group]|uniref:hypothetical protein n=1 Tax=Bacillus amyloliquefaciens group TaxID=1938374 RepID=UPI00059D5795|nr:MULTISPECIES: hypothetical protein [Bacillus amyloliquefaciens group]AJK66651.1 hypothetical protein KHU1_2708 [Bacillus amyloliquefaciens KHG19]AMQ75693.1 hypothetical protein BAMY6614_19290 [Bacillus amyloliquefaciens UMAF6614]AWM49192.1 hypothetical protein DDT09_15635 [Bacillus amyloliquefaciens]KOC22293.1 hypothetical protein AC810_14715 [Bacillus velezensis]KOC23158.1 hypothetical protein AC811_14720 [Bacillus velezensis]
MKLAKNALLSLAIVLFVFAPFFNSSASAAGPTTKVNKNLFQPQSETRVNLKVGEIRNYSTSGNRITFNPMGYNPPAVTWRALGTDYKTIQVFAVAKGEAWIEFYDDSFTWKTRYHFVVQ